MSDPAREAAEKWIGGDGLSVTDEFAYQQLADIIRHAFADALEDQKRLDWLEGHDPEISHDSTDDGLDRWTVGRNYIGYGSLREAIDNAIDAARAEEGGDEC